MEKIRVLNVLLDPRVSGPARRILEVGAKIRAKGIETVLVMPEGDSNIVQDAIEKDIKIFQQPLKRLRKTKNPIPNFVWLFSLFSNVASLIRLIRQERIDIVHCNGLVQIVGGLAGRIGGARVMWHLNDVAVPRTIQKIFKPVVQLNSDLILFSSQAVESHLGWGRQRLPSGILYAPVDTRYFDKSKAEGAREGIRQSLGVPPDGILVGMVGNVNYLKGIPDFVKAARIVQERRSQVRFVHVGAKLSTKEDLYREVETDISRFGLASHFFLAGARNDVREFLSAMDIFVMPSISEACPMALLEAMAMEKPIVATRVGGIPELVRDGQEALLVPIDSPGQVAEKILFYLDHPTESLKMAQQARARAVQYFDIDRCVSEHERYYRMLVG